ncbi:hypothetical protein EPO05_03820 [Patescibacteria group bacterium]|nr:MAG: hypothetical protein EPO05_03820 [Patescibacteria group bacterium]
MKKIFIISGVMLGVTVLAWGIYMIAFRVPAPASDSSTSTKDSTKISNESSDTQNKIQASSESAAIQIVTNEGVMGLYVGDGNDGPLKYYTTGDGDVYQISLDGTNLQSLANNSLTGLASVNWSPRGNKAITSFKRDGVETFYVYDFDSKQGNKMKDGVDTISWSNLGDKIIYKYFDATTKQRSVNVAEPDGKNWQKLADTPYRNLKISQIPQSSQVAFWNKPSANEETDLELASIVGAGATRVMAGKFGADYLWSPNGEFMLVSSVEQGGKKLMLGVASKDGKNYQSLGIPTLASKCAWTKNSEKVYCAWPSIDEGVVMPDDYQDGKMATRDTFWKVNVLTGEKKRVMELKELESINQTFDASNLVVSPKEDVLFFINRTDQKLYRIELDRS